jgi:hypothetical protein
MGLSIEYLCATTSATSQQIEPHLKISNTGTSSVALSDLTVRYFFSADGSTSQMFACDYALIGCSNLTGTFNAWTGGGAGADHYLELSFSAGAGSVSPGADSGEIQARFYDASFATFTQTGDYSFNPADTSYTTWNQITIYQNGTLVWGTEP